MNNYDRLFNADNNTIDNVVTGNNSIRSLITIEDIEAVREELY